MADINDFIETLDDLNRLTMMLTGDAIVGVVFKNLNPIIRELAEDNLILRETLGTGARLRGIELIQKGLDEDDY